MKRAALVVLLLVLVLVPAVGAQEWYQDNHWSVYYPNSASYCNCGSASGLDDIYYNATGFTVEGWVRPDDFGYYGGGSDGYLFAKTRWQVYFDNTYGLIAYLNCYGTDAISRVGRDDIVNDKAWHHITVSFLDDDYGGDAKFYIAIDGVWVDYDAQVALNETSCTSDASQYFYLGNEYFGGAAIDGNIGWVRVSDTSARYTVGVDFTPPVEFPAADAHTVEAWSMADGSGTTASAQVSSPANDCTCSNIEWEYWSAQEMDSGLVAWWDLEEDGGTRYDALGDSDLTDNNTAPIASGLVGSAAGFDSANAEYLSHVDSAVLSTGDISFTVAGWVYLDTIAADGPLLSKGDEFSLYYDAAGYWAWNVGTGVTSGTVPVATPAPGVSDWYLLVGSHDPGDDEIAIQAYKSGYTSKNSTDLETSSYAGGGSDGSDPLYLGRMDSTYLSGRLDSVGIWKYRKLNADERGWLYNQGNGRAYSDFPTPSPTPIPTATPDPTTSEYWVTLPSNKTGKWYTTITAGEATIATVLLVMLFLFIYQFLRETVLKWLQR